jgi:fructokinase
VEQSWFFLTQCDFFKVSDEEALLLTGADTLEDAAQQLLEKTKAVFAITLGKEGTLLGRDGKTSIISSIAVNPVDTTGAGDAFVGAVLYQLTGSAGEELSTKEWETIILNANKAGARTCEYLGAMEAFRHLSNDIFK